MKYLPFLRIGLICVISGFSGALAGPARAATAVTPSSVALSPTSVAGGASSTGTVTLSAVAPTGGTVVTLTSSSTAATVPASVTVAAAAKTATFTVKSIAVAANASVTISAATGGTTKTATLTVTAPALSSVALSPTSVVGGVSSTGTVTISSAAPAGGLAVTLTSSSTSATVPASVTVAAGATTATFTATSIAVAANASVTVTAKLGSASKTATLTVTAPVPSSVTLSPASVVGGASSTGTVTLASAAPSAGLSVTLKSSVTDAVVPASVKVAAGATSATFTITTTATAGSPSITATSNSAAKSATLTVSKPAAAPAISSTEGGSQETYLAWSSVTNAASYNLERGTASTGPFTVIASIANVANSTITYYDKTGLTNGTTYYYAACSVDGGVSSAYSAVVSITPTAVIPPASVTVSAYPGFNYLQYSMTGQGYNSINLYRGTVSGGPYTLLASPTFADYGDTSGVSGTTYYYVVTRVLGLSESPYSTQVSAKAVGITLPPVTVTAGNASALISFNNPFYGAAPFGQYYDIYRGTSASGPFAYDYSGTSTGVLSISHSDTGLTNGTTYYYTIDVGTAIDEEGDEITSPESSPVAATPESSLGTEALGASHSLATLPPTAPSGNSD